MRQALHDLLVEQQMVTADASTGEAAIRKALEFRPDVVIMDVRLPDMNGIVAARRIKDAIPMTQIVVLTANDDDHTVLTAIEAGAISVVPKDEDMETVLRAIHQASSGQPYLPPAIARRVMHAAAGHVKSYHSNEPSERTRSPASHERAAARPLTTREVEILTSIARGAHNRDVALELGISERTVINHLVSVYGKLGIRSRTGATAYAVKYKLITP